MESCKWLKTCVFSAENLRLRTPVCGILETTFIISMLHTNSRLYGGHKKSGAIITEWAAQLAPENRFVPLFLVFICSLLAIGSIDM